jgi:hypothetical protein
MSGHCVECGLTCDKCPGCRHPRPEAKEARPKADLQAESTDSRRVATEDTVLPDGGHRLDGFCWCQPTAELDGDGHIYVHREVLQ